MKLTVREMAEFSLLGAIIFISKQVLEFLPNVHMIATLIVAYTVCFRKKALYPIFVFIFLEGLIAGFNSWWLPYLYLWPLLWLVTMMLPKNMKAKKARIVYMIICALHGFLYGTLYAPAQAILFGLNFRETIAWIVTGLPWDMIHGVSNFFMAILVIPIVNAITKAENYIK